MIGFVFDGRGILGAGVCVLIFYGWTSDIA